MGTPARVRAAAMFRRTRHIQAFQEADRCRQGLNSVLIGITLQKFWPPLRPEFKVQGRCGKNPLEIFGHGESNDAVFKAQNKSEHQGAGLSRGGFYGKCIPDSF